MQPREPDASECYFGDGLCQQKPIQLGAAVCVHDSGADMNVIQPDCAYLCHAPECQRLFLHHQHSLQTCEYATAQHVPM